ncbi:hypothetical protein [Mycolicibacterium confluentis]|uniref:Uncharacterized protein n=1 Tax=Mycolicibacterium confluentis TaxID=28047 RepID=A0A7I7Y1P7_9MYCO|nr:hypothetical protein [Mycolicibacterium confluentis]MCV7320498.1 hypothetical protein [Mycolicibacterium confluentis]ORV30159.1 hypothetical protein AWB99_13695 [Mycolicibacterium confluentis]BBZ35536.1 hypothetical protein MCNF_41410 [Mycolicibacterium confluentis]
MTISANILHPPPQNSANKLVTNSNKLDHPNGSAEAEAPAPATAAQGSDSFWPQVAAIVALTGVGYMFVFAGVVADVLNGSRNAYLLTVPVLILLIVSSYRSCNDGVGDSESDWILAVLLGVGGLVGIHLFTQRGPTVAALWHLDLVGVAFWIACCAVVVAGSRRVFRAWAAGAFLLCCLTPLPSQLAVAHLGGSDADAAMVAAALGATAVFLCGRGIALHWRIAAAAGCLLLAAITTTTLDGVVGLTILVLIAGGAVPVLCAALLYPLRPAANPLRIGGSTPPPLHRSPRTIVLLTLGSLGMLAAHPLQSPPAAPASAPADWVTNAGLLQPTPIPFISRFLGPDASLTRYTAPVPDGSPPAVVDVMTSSNLAGLRDYTDAVWYPSAEPLNYRPADPELGAPNGSRVVYNNPDIATSDAEQHWYAVTWLWRTPDAYERVTVLVNQSQTSHEPPPMPRPLSISNTLIDPTLWLSRRQSSDAGELNPSVMHRAAEVVRVITETSGRDG